MLTLKVINLLAGPGAGKSTLAAGLFNLMKSQGMSVELVTEFAKDLTYEKNHTALGNQLYLLGQQDQRLRRLEGQVEWVITDSPLPLGLAYLPDSGEYDGWLADAVWAAYDRYENYHVLVHRGDTEFQQFGRNQTEAEARVLDNVIDHIFDRATEDEEDFAFEVYQPKDPKAPYKLLAWLMAVENGE